VSLWLEKYHPEIAMRFFLSNEDNPVDQKHPLWNEPLPLSRHGELPANGRNAKMVLTYGEYFSAIKTFFNDPLNDFIAGTFPSLVHSDIGKPDLDHLSVYLEKHGAFYHPSRIVMPLENRTVEFVLNVAISEAGKECLENEYTILKTLGKKYSYPFLPKAYVSQEIPVDASRTVNMFMGEWFGSFCEFHASTGNDPGLSCIRVWDPENENFFLSMDQALSIYEQAAMILTACYDIETFEQVFSWHHAAGDFVVTFDERRAPQVKLVTVRQYAPLFEVGEDSSEVILNGLLLFLLNMSLRMRLDRLDGVGEICWIDDFAVEGTLTGFLKGLEIQVKNHQVPAGFIESFRSYLTRLGTDEMRDLFAAIAGRLNPHSPDLPTLHSHLARHTESFYRMMKTAF